MRVFYSKFRLGSNSRHQICPRYNNTDTFTRERQLDRHSDRQKNMKLRFKIERERDISREVEMIKKKMKD